LRYRSFIPACVGNPLILLGVLRFSNFVFLQEFGNLEGLEIFRAGFEGLTAMRAESRTLISH
jgi:hypothetical protein